MNKKFLIYENLEPRTLDVKRLKKEKYELINFFFHTLKRGGYYIKKNMLDVKSEQEALHKATDIQHPNKSH